jgi:hypothetical protein
VGAVLPTFGDVVQSVKSYPTWEYNLISTLGGKPNPVNLLVLNLWAAKEGVNPKANNWLAVSNPNNFLGVTDPQYLANNPDSIASFPTESAGVNGIAQFLQAGHKKVISALINPQATVADIANAITTDGAWGGDGAYILSTFTGDTTLGLTVPVYRDGATTGPQGDTVGAGDATFKQCNSQNVILGEGGILGVGKANLLNACQAKAIVGGLLVGLGGAIFLGGLALIVTKGVESQGVGAILGRGAAKDITAPVKGAATTATTASTAPVAARPARPAPTPLAPGQHVTNYKGRPHLETWVDSQGRTRSKAIF